MPRRHRSSIPCCFPCWNSLRLPDRSPGKLSRATWVFVLTGFDWVRRQGFKFLPIYNVEIQQMTPCHSCGCRCRFRQILHHRVDIPLHAARFAMAQWDEDDYGSMANKSCWLMFAILTGSCFDPSQSCSPVHRNRQCTNGPPFQKLSLRFESSPDYAIAVEDWSAAWGSTTSSPSSVGSSSSSPASSSPSVLAMALEDTCPRWRRNRYHRPSNTT